MSEPVDRMTEEFRRLDDELSAAVTLPPVDTVIGRASALNRASTAAAAAVITVGALGTVTAVAQVAAPEPVGVQDTAVAPAAPAPALTERLEIEEGDESTTRAPDLETAEELPQLPVPTAEEPVLPAPTSVVPVPPVEEPEPTQAPQPQPQPGPTSSPTKEPPGDPDPGPPLTQTPEPPIEEPGDVTASAAPTSLLTVIPVPAAGDPTAEAPTIVPSTVPVPVTALGVV